MTQKYYTYVLKSESDAHLYVGMISDLRKRVSEHNKGKVRSTKSRRPLRLAYHEEFPEKTSARKRELFLKSGQGRIFLKAKIKDMENSKHRTEMETF
jgi:putative endonuclease